MRTSSITIILLLCLAFACLAGAAHAQSATTYAYIANMYSYTVSVIDTATNQVVATIQVGSEPGAVAVSPDGTKAYVANEVSNTVSVIDTATNQVTATINVGGHPEGVAVSPDGTKAYVTNYIGTVSVIDTATNQVTATINLGGIPYGVAFSPAGKTAYVTNCGSDTVFVIDTATNQVTATINVGGNRYGVAVNPDGRTVYVTGSTVSVIDTATNQVTATINVGGSPEGVAFSPDGTTAYVANYGSNTVSVIDTATNQVTATINVGSSPIGVALTPDGTTAYVTNLWSNNVSVIDTATNQVIATINVGRLPNSLGQFIIPPSYSHISEVASFTYSQVQNSWQVNFQDLSYGSPISWEWNFGDNSANNTQQSPSHFYAEAGTYNVTLTAGYADGNTSTVQNTVTVTTVYPEVASFTYSQVKNLLRVNFQDTSSGSPTSWEWDFGDNSANNTQQSPSYAYAQAGTYNVTLTAGYADGNTSTVQNTVTVAAIPPGLPPVYAYIPNTESSNVTVIDTATNQVVANINVGFLPYSAAVSPDGTKAYVTSGQNGIVSVIDTATNQVTANISVGDPMGVAVSPNGMVYVANSGSNTVSVINPVTYQVTATINVGVNPAVVAVSPDGTKAYVTAIGSSGVWSANGTVSVIDTETNQVTATINTGDHPHGVAVSPDGTKAYVTSPGNGTVYVIDTATNQVTATINAGDPRCVAFSPDGTTAYVTNYVSSTVSVINTETNQVTATIPVGSGAMGVAVTPDGTTVYVANRLSGTVSVIDTATNHVAATVNVGSEPYAFGQFITPAPPSSPISAPVANFSASPTSDRSPLTVQFTDTSSNGPIVWDWSFGDGGTSTEQNPVYTYDLPGNYTVSLTAYNTAGSNTTIKTNYITVEMPPVPVANFTADVTAGACPLAVQFTDTGVDATAWQWNFGDGAPNSTDRDPVHIYTVAGTYDVSLTVSNPAGSCSTAKAGYIINMPAPDSSLGDSAWPKYQHDNSNTGLSQYNGPQTNNVIWSYKLSSIMNDGMYGSPVIGTDGNIYVGGYYDHNLFAFYPNGTLYWSYPTNAWISGTPAIGADGTIYIGSSALYPNGTLKWDDYLTTGEIASSPAIGADGTIYIGGNDYRLYALNPDGTQKWNYTTGYRIASSPAIGADGTIYVGITGGQLYALYPNGTLKWSYTAVAITNSPSIGAGGTIYIGTGANLSALYPNGTLKWNYATGGYTGGGQIQGTAAIGADGTIYFGGTSGHFYALYPNGTQKWDYTTGGIYGSSATIGADGTIYFGSMDSNLYALNPDGTLKWSCEAGTRGIQNSPAIGADGTLYIGSVDYMFYAFKDVAAPVVANFTADVVDGTAPLAVQFTDLSTNASAWQWDFGDGTNSTEQDPVYTYSAAGTYTVSLTTTNSAGSDTETKTDYITVDESPVAPVNATITGYSIPTSMVASESYPVSVTVQNTGALPWNESSMFRLGMVGDYTGDAYLFDGTTTRVWLPEGTNVQPGESVTFTYTMTAPSTLGTYHPSYQMVWEGNEWFGEQLNTNIDVTAPLLNAEIASTTIPSSMNAGSSYPVSITVKNTGSLPWNESSMFRLGMVDDYAGDSFKFDGNGVRAYLPEDANVLPGESMTFSFAVTAPAEGTYHPSYRMVWEGRQWFGDTTTTTVDVSGPDAVITGNTIPTSMTAGESYPVSITVQNTGTLPWNESSMFRLGMVDDQNGDAYLFDGTTTRVWLPEGANVQPGDTVTFTYTMTAPTTPGTYHPSYQMVWDGHQWFSEQQTTTVEVAGG